MEEYEHSKPMKHGDFSGHATHLTGKHKRAKSEAVAKKMESKDTMAGKVLRLHKGKE